MKEQNKFEDQWQNAFEDAEMAPSNAVWNGVELSLEAEVNKKFKKRVTYFKWVAAASIIFALTLGGISVYTVYIESDNLESPIVADNEDDKDDEADDKIEIDSLNPDKDVFSKGSVSPENVDKLPATDEGAEGKNKNKVVQQIPKNKTAILPKVSQGFGVESGQYPDSSKSMTAFKSDKQINKSQALGKESDLISESTTTNLISVKSEGTNVNTTKEIQTTLNKGVNKDSNTPRSLHSSKEKVIISQTTYEASYTATSPDYLEPIGLDSSQEPNILLEPTMVPWYYHSRNKSKKEVRWAGIGFAAGSLLSETSNPRSDNGTEFMLSDAMGTPTPAFVSDEVGGSTMDFGVNVGAQLSSKWIVQGGVGYSQRQSSNSSNIIASAGNSYTRVLNDVASLESSENAVITSPYELSNKYELINIPLQTGYILMDRKFNITILSGISSEIFIRNKIWDASGVMRGTTIKAGESSRYRTYVASGMLGTEVSYDLGEHYMISITPQLRQSINSFTKSGDAHRPTIFEAGFKFKYLIK